MAIEIAKSLAYVGLVSNAAEGVIFTKGLGYVSYILNPQDVILSKGLAYTGFVLNDQDIILTKSLAYGGLGGVDGIELGFIAAPSGTFPIESGPGEAKYTLLPEIERNPYRAHLGDDPTQINEDLKEQQRILREQHDKTQAGDTTFDYGLLLKSYPNQEFTLGSLGRFFHDDFGLIQARFVKFAKMVESEWPGQPVGRLGKKTTTQVDWVVTNDFELSGSDLAMGFSFQLDKPEDGYYGWVVVDGCNPLPIQPGSEVIPPQDAPYVWTQTATISVDEPGKVVGRRWGNHQGFSLPAGSFYIRLENESPASRAEQINQILEPVQEAVEEIKESDLETADKIAAIEAALADLDSADEALSRLITNTSKTLAREIQAIRNSTVIIDIEALLARVRAELTDAFGLADQVALNAATNALNIANEVKALIASLDTRALLEGLDGVGSAISALGDRFGGLSFDTTTIPLVENQVFITKKSINGDGNAVWTLKPVGFTIRNLFDVNDGAPANGTVLVYDSPNTEWVARSPVTLPSEYSVPFGFTTAPQASEIMLIHSFAQAVVFPGNFAGATSVIGTPPAATFVFTIRNGLTNVGTITISNAGVVTFASPGGAAVSFAAGESISVVAPATADSAFVNSAFTFLGVTV